MSRKSPSQSKILNDTHDIMTFMTHVHRHFENTKKNLVFLWYFAHFSLPLHTNQHNHLK